MNLQSLKSAVRFNGVMNNALALLSVYKAHVTRSCVSTALARSCLKFQSTVRSQANFDIFRLMESIISTLATCGNFNYFLQLS